MKDCRLKALCGILALMLALSVLAGCGSSAKTSDVMPAAASSTTAMGPSGALEEAPAEAEMIKTENGYNDYGAADYDYLTDTETASVDTQSVTVQTDERKIIKYSDMMLQTKEFDATLEKLLQLVADCGGYIDSQNVDGYNLYNSSHKGYYSRTAYISARIPTDKLANISEAVAEICNVSSRSESRQDITDTYYDATVRLSTLQVQETRLLELLARAEDLADVIELEKALSDVQYQIESMQGQLRRMDNQVAYSYLNMSLQEVVEYSENINEPATFGERLALAAKNAWVNIKDTCEGILLFVVEYAMVIIIWLALIVLVVLLVRWIIRKLRGRRSVSGDKPPRKAWFAKKDKAAPKADDGIDAPRE